MKLTIIVQNISNAHEPTPAFIEAIEKLEHQQAALIAKEILLKPFDQRIPFYRDYVIGRFHDSICEKIASQFAKFVPNPKDCFFLTREEINTIPEEILKYHTQASWSCICIQNTDFVISPFIQLPDDIKEWIPDFTVKIGEESFLVNSFLLIQASEYFEGMFRANYTEKQSSAIDLTSTLTRNEFLAFSRYLYHHHMDDTEEEFLALAKCAEYFQIPSMERFLQEKYSGYFKSLMKASVSEKFYKARNLFNIAPGMKMIYSELIQEFTSKLHMAFYSSAPFEYKDGCAFFEGIFTDDFREMFLPDFSINCSEIRKCLWDALSHMHIKALFLSSNNGLSPEDGEVIGSMEIQELKLGGGPFLTDDFLKRASTVKGIQILTINQECRLTSESAITIAQMKIVELTLYQLEWINHEALVEISKSETLKRIFLDMDNVASVLYDYPNRSYEALSAKDIQVLFQMKSLKLLILRQAKTDLFNGEQVRMEAEKLGIEFIHFDNYQYSNDE